MAYGWIGWCVETRCVGTEFRPETDTSVEMGDSWWEARLFAARGRCNVYHF